MAYRACDEVSESHMFRRPDDEQRRIPGLSDQNGSGVAAGELDQPIRAWVDLVEYRRNAGAVTRINLVEGQVPFRLLSRSGLRTPNGELSACTARSTTPVPRA